MTRFKAFASDDEEDDASSVSSHHQSYPQKQNKPAVRTLSLTPSSSSSSTSEEDNEDADNSDVESLMDERELRPSYVQDDVEGDEVVPWPQQLNLEPQRVHVMQTSLFRMPELASLQPMQSLTQSKHPRPPDAALETREYFLRTSFAQSRAQPREQPPSRKYIRVASSASVSASHEGAFVDAGLSFGRSFRVGWGPGGRLVHLGNICKPTASCESANSSVIKITKVQLSNLESSPDSPDLLSHLLANTPISLPSFEQHGVPYVTLNHKLTFASFSSLFEPSDNSHAASLFRLGHALFDPLDLHLADSVRPSLRNRVIALRRADALSSWLARAVAFQVEQDLKASSSVDSATIAFLHMTGNQIERAVEMLTNGGNIHLASLVSQMPGDEQFRIDIRDQLHIWKEEKVDALISGDILKIYALAAGVVDFLQGSGRNEDIEPGNGLDWLRVLGLQLWFASFMDDPLKETFESYERLFKESPKRAAPPVPWHSKLSETDQITVTDGLFSLIKLALSPSTTLESTLNPLSFGPNPRDYRLPWFIYVLLSRCMRVRDFTDRDAVDTNSEDESEDVYKRDAYSAVADTLTASYASQLEQEGQIQEAMFVLLFLEDDIGRKRAIKDILARSAPMLDEWNVAGINGSLKIPREWIDEAKAAYAFYQGNIYEAYELYTQGSAHKVAHELAIAYLAPEAILRDDLELLRSLFDALDKTEIPNWGIGGQVFIDYAMILTRVPELKSQNEVDAIPDASELEELERLMARIPKLVGILPDVMRSKPGGDGKCNAALSTMLSNLLECLDTGRPVKVDILPGLTNEAAVLRHIHSTAYGSFMQTITTVL